MSFIINIIKEEHTVRDDEEENAEDIATSFEVKEEKETFSESSKEEGNCKWSPKKILTGINFGRNNETDCTDNICKRPKKIFAAAVSNDIINFNDDGSDNEDEVQEVKQDAIRKNEESDGGRSEIKITKPKNYQQITQENTKCISSESQKLQNDKVGNEGASTSNAKEKYKCRYTCFQCGLQCFKSSIPEEHIKLEHEKQPNLMELTCPTCKEVYTCRSDLVSHIENAHKNSLPHCDQCDRTFTHKTRYQQHMFNVHGVGEPMEKLFACSFQGCTKRFREQYMVNSHAKCHLPKSLACPVCGKPCRFTRDLKRHVKTHEKVNHIIHIKKISSEMCPAKGAKDELKTHIEDAHHQNKSTTELGDGVDVTADQVHRCPTCEKTYQSETKMKRHVQTYHKQEKVSCELCGKVWKSKKHLKSHMKSMHENPIPFHCPRIGCKCSFRTEIKLQKHMLIHKDNGHICDYCGKVFKFLQRLKQHVTVIHSENRRTKPFICELCGKGFAANLYLKYHIKNTHEKSKR